MTSPTSTPEKEIEVIPLFDLDATAQEEFQSVFTAQLEPLYGDQSEALRKIFEERDRSVRIIINTDGGIAGILVYKDLPNDDHGVPNSLEIKTLMLVDPEKNGGQGFGARLMREAEEAAMRVGASAIAVTVAQDKQESQRFFSKHGFSVRSKITDAYREGNVESIFSKSIGASSAL